MNLSVRLLTILSIIQYKYMQDIGEVTIIHTTTLQKSLISHDDTPNKEKTVTNTVKLSPNMKSIISQIRQNSLKRMRRCKQEEIQRSDYNVQVEQMVKTIKINKKSSLTNTMTDNDLTNAIFTKQLHIEAVVSHNQQKRKKILSLLQILEKKTCLRKNLQESLKNIQRQNKNTMLQLNIFHSLEQKHEQTKRQVIDLRQKVLEKEEQLSNISKEVQAIINKTAQTIQKTNDTHVSIQKAKQFQIILSQILVQSSKRKIPNQQQMIKCMFLVGILSQQNFVLFLEKKQRCNQKTLIQEKSNKFYKIYQNICKRTIIINCKNSEIVHLRIITSIYMHCKSLALANLVTIMNTLSFFSQEFKTIYHYKQFLKYVKILMEKMKFNPEWERMKSAVEPTTKDLPAHKKQLIISVKQENFLLLQSILEIFLIENEYIVNLGSLKMKLRLETNHGAKSQCETSQQLSKLAFSSVVSEDNRLHFEFYN